MFVFGNSGQNYIFRLYKMVGNNFILRRYENGGHNFIFSDIIYIQTLYLCRFINYVNLYL